MVSIREIRASNAQLTEANIPQVAVFVGGTSGIGKATIGRLASLGCAVKIYIVGRKSAEPAMRVFIAQLKSNNPNANLIWLEAEVALLSEVKRVCGILKGAEKKIDLLFLSAGYAPFAGRNNTSDGIDITHALGYYGRVLFIYHLLPLLRMSTSPRVISVLTGGVLSKNFSIDDLNLEKRGAFSGMKSQLQMGTMNTLTMDHFAAEEENANITFVHSWPGAVDTGNERRYSSSSIPLTTLMKPMFWLMGFDVTESADRHLYIATSKTFGGEQNNSMGGNKTGLILLDKKCNTSHNNTLLKELKEKAQATVWVKTMELLALYL